MERREKGRRCLFLRETENNSNWKQKEYLSAWWKGEGVGGTCLFKGQD